MDENTERGEVPESGEPGGQAGGPLRQGISNAIVGLYKEHYGKGPTRNEGDSQCVEPRSTPVDPANYGPRSRR